MDSHWIAQSGDRYPYTSPSTWRTRGWLLVRKTLVSRETTDNDRRVAMLLLGKNPAKLGYHADLRIRLEEIAYGRPTDDTSPSGEA